MCLFCSTSRWNLCIISLLFLFLPLPNHGTSQLFTINFALVVCPCSIFHETACRNILCHDEYWLNLLFRRRFGPSQHFFVFRGKFRCCFSLVLSGLAPFLEWQNGILCDQSPRETFIVRRIRKTGHVSFFGPWYNHSLALRLACHYVFLSRKPRDLSIFHQSRRGATNKTTTKNVCKKRIFVFYLFLGAESRWAAPRFIMFVISSQFVGRDDKNLPGKLFTEHLPLHVGVP